MKKAHNPVSNSRRTQHDHHMPIEDEIMIDFRHEPSGYDSEYPTTGSMRTDPLFDEEPDPFEKVRIEEERKHAERIRTLLLDFVDRDYSYSVEDICGPSAWSTFTEEEKYQAEYLIVKLTTELNLTLQPVYGQSYPGPRRFKFM